MTLSPQQFKELRNEGLNVDQIIRFENGQIPTSNPKLQNKADELEINQAYKNTLKEQRSALETRAFFPARTGESPMKAGLKAAGNLFSSAGTLAFNIGSAILNPIQTVKGVGLLAKGVGEKLGREILERTPVKTKVEQVPEGEAEQIFNLVSDSLKERFGSLEAAQRTATNDPLGFAFDVVPILSGLGITTKVSRLNLLQSIRQQLSTKLRQSAIKDFEKVLSPTKETTKILTSKVASKLAERKVTAFSLRGLEEKVANEIRISGQKVDDAFDVLPDETKLKTKPLIDSLEETKQKFMVEDVIVEPSAFKAAQDLQEIIIQFGDEIEINSLRRLRQIWDDAIDKTNGFQKNLSDLDKIDIKKEATNAMRTELAKDFPNIDLLNKEFNFWSNTQKVLKETLRRKTGQKGGVIQRGFGSLIGAFLGKEFGPAGSATGAFTGSKLVQLFDSTAWKTFSAKRKTELAELLVEGDINKINRFVEIIIGSQIAEEVISSQKEE